MIPVTKSFLPSREDYNTLLDKVWESGWLTNRGNLVNQLEKNIQGKLNSSPLIAMTNGTLPIQIAIKTLQLRGEIITTPFSYVATVSSIVWEGCEPVFVDIHKEYLTIDETKIEAAITPKTTAILATHVFGNPCNVEEIEKIATKYKLKVIYDAAHCFGVEYKEQSVFNYGDLSTCSFHATKLFHTGEGGAVFINNLELKEKVFYHHNFGHKGPEDFQGIGINAKMSELQAAMGLSVLPHIDEIINNRNKSVSHYKKLLSASVLLSFAIRPNTKWNGCYFPIIFENETQLLKVKQQLQENNINTRRYFYPSLNKLPYVVYKSCPVSEYISSTILCLPLYYGLQESEIEKIVKIIKASL